MTAFLLRGKAFITSTKKPDMHSESDAMTYSPSETVKLLFLKQDLVTLFI
jgi:hypothetical protein